MDRSSLFALYLGRMIAVLLLFQVGARVAMAAQVPAMWVFGDSLVDDGNNNYISSLAKSNFQPYGVDFNQGPTGRFCNGKTIVDMFCDMMALPYLPAYSNRSTKGVGLLHGVNYASAAAGILDETGQNYGERISLSQQVLNFESNLDDLRSQMTTGNLSQFLAKSIVVMVFGSNDYINNYLMPSMYSSSFNYAPQEFADLLINHYTRQILALHSVGLRKFFLAGVGPLGCVPNQRATGMAPAGRCYDYVNEIVGPFNEGLRSLVELLNGNHPGAIFTYGNTYAGVGDMLNNPASYGFNVIDHGCCGLAEARGIACLPLSLPCTNRKEYLFWDAFHPTEAANAVLSQRAFSGPPNDCYPINVQQMTQV